MSPRPLASLGLALLLAAGSTPSALAQSVSAPPASAALSVAPEYLVGAGDVLQVIVFPVEEYSREVTVQPDGMVELPMIGAVLVKGLTVKEIQTLVEAKLARFVAAPRVTVNVRRFSGRRVAIIGEVRSPGYYEFRDGMTILELFAQAGGPTDYAKPSRTRILRFGSPKPTTFGVDLADVLRGAHEKNLLMAAGDTVYVPKGRFTQNAQWTTANILPWLSLLTAVISLSVLIHTETP